LKLLASAVAVINFLEITDAPSANTAIYLERTIGSRGVPSGKRFSLSLA